MGTRGPNSLRHRLTIDLVTPGKVRAATKEIRDALDANDGQLKLTAAALGCSVPTIYRIVDRAGLTEHARKLRAAAGIKGPKRGWDDGQA